MAKPVDLELKKAFADLQVKVIETRKKIYEIDGEIILLTGSLTQVSISSCGIQNLPENTRTYEAVGRMFMFKSVPTLNKDFQERHKNYMARIKALKDEKERYEKNLKESEDNIREMIQMKKEQSDTKT